MKNRFNYTTVPPELLYCKRQYLDDFGVYEKSSLNYFIQEKLYEKYSNFTNYEEFATDLFNCAYYICTMALAESHPEIRFGAYKRIIDETVRYNNRDYAGSILAIILLQMWARRWDVDTHHCKRLAKKFEEELQKIEYHFTFKEFFCDVTQKLQASGIYKIDSDDEFTPREIYRKLLNDSFNREELIARFDIDDEGKMLEFIYAIGKTEKEQNIIVEFLRDELHSAFDNGLLHKSFFDGLKRQVYKNYHADEDNARTEAEINEQIEAEYMQQFELEDYKKRCEKLEAENASIRAEIEELKNREVLEPITESQFNEIFYGIPSNEHHTPSTTENVEQSHSDDNSSLLSQIEELTAERDKYKTLYEASDNQNKRYEKEFGKLEDLSEEEKLSINERIIFIHTLLGCSLKEDCVNQVQLAKMISRLTGDKPISIRRRINKINNETQDVDDNEKDSYSPGVQQAATNVYNLIHKAVTGATVGSKPYRCKQAMEDINKTYHLNIPPHQPAPEEDIE